jgi:hypothetical protein
MSKIQIRNGLFETNSSSTHCIVIAKDEVWNYPEVKFTLGQFDWEHKIYTDTHTKAQYLYTAIMQLEDKESLEALKKRLDYEQVKYSFEEPKEGEFYYIDHGDNLKYWVPFVCHDLILLLNYLFSEESFVETGNDGMDDDEFTKKRPERVLLEYFKTN